MYSGGGLPIPEIEFSGAMQRISTKAFEGLSVASIDEALQGRISGLDIVGNSGDVGSGSSLRIRGITSINSSSTPLILLNDIPFESNIDASFDFATATQDQFATLLNISPSGYLGVEGSQWRNLYYDQKRSYRPHKSLIHIPVFRIPATPRYQDAQR